MRCTSAGHEPDSRPRTDQRVTRPSPAALAVPTLLLLVACGEPAESAPDAQSPAADAPTDDPRGAQPFAGPEDAPDEVYFDLTRHEWYRQGQPLLHGQRRFQPQGDPVAVATDSLRKVGRYQQVDYYARTGEREPFYTLFVPVYYGYWQRFTAPPGS